MAWVLERFVYESAASIGTNLDVISNYVEIQVEILKLAAIYKLLTASWA
jgi:hypothetical protein